ncbi:NUDIX hydrolase [Streptomyces sp. ST2-7A]|uniref:NUDIX hydrolase n=1 Tax=Streptomyces sp. ST2-7A TaxID=2907214 RepID=UPI001F43681B|nr:NUDIX hydrolase [Streptomyces sp. ST2-7A]MCE7080064.1 NUDIX hydrolase [Streptomyces sp. ST2-7A]
MGATDGDTGGVGTGDGGTGRTAAGGGAADAGTSAPSPAGGQWFPPEWAGRIRALWAGELVPPEPRRAATVMLLRDGPLGGSPVEVYLLRRRASMAFGAGAHAYPGGGVDPRDEEWDDAAAGWSGPDRSRWAARLGVSEAVAQSIVCAAVRETFEESGVLLAGPHGGGVVADTTGDDWEVDRRALVDRKLSFSEFLARRRLVLRSELLAPWTRWITPEFESRRYDTWFFVAALPVGQRARNASTEADRTLWTAPGDAYAGYRRGELLMMPPTAATLRELAESVDSAEPAVVRVAADGRDLSPVLARTRREGGEIVIHWPGYEEFEKRMPDPEAGGGAEERR